MTDKSIQSSIFKKGLKSIPNFIWVFCASYALIMITNLFVLNFAHIDADKHINRYLDILLSQKEAKKDNKDCKIPEIIDEMQHDINKLKRNSHKQNNS